MDKLEPRRRTLPPEKPELPFAERVPPPLNVIGPAVGPLFAFGEIVPPLPEVALTLMAEKLFSVIPPAPEFRTVTSPPSPLTKPPRAESVPTAPPIVIGEPVFVLPTIWMCPPAPVAPPFAVIEPTARVP